MPTFRVIVVEQVTVFISQDIEADTKEEAAQIGFDSWVINGEGDKSENVDDRTVEVDGEPFEIEE